jgi:hypothetical protein
MTTREQETVRTIYKSLSGPVGSLDPSEALNEYRSRYLLVLSDLVQLIRVGGLEVQERQSLRTIYDNIFRPINNMGPVAVLKECRTRHLKIIVLLISLMREETPNES